MKRFEDFNPIVIFAYFIMTTGICMFSMHPAVLLLSGIGGILFFNAVDHRSAFEKIKTHGKLLLFFLLLSLLNPLFYHNGVTVLFVLNNNPITLEALLYGACRSMMVVSVIYWFRAFSVIMTSDKLLYVFGLLSPHFSLVLSMALRYIPLLASQRRKTERAQRAIGLYSSDSIPKTIVGNTRVFGILVTWALENGITTADSMSARGYGTKKRTFFSIYRFTGKDLLLLFVFALLFSSSLVFLVKGVMAADFYPELHFSNQHSLLVSACFVYGVLSLFPTVYTFFQELKWKYLQSKI